MSNEDSLPAVFQKICTLMNWERDDNAAVVPLPNARHQRVHADLVHEDGEELLRLRSTVGDASVLNEVRLRAALRLNARLQHGAIAICETDLALVDTFLLRDLDQDELLASIEYLARKADEYERALFGTDQH